MKKRVGTFLFLSLVLVTLSLSSFSQKHITKTPSKPKPVSDNRDTLEMVFVLDTTGSMGGLIEVRSSASGESSTTLCRNLRSRLAESSRSGWFLTEW